VFFGVMVWLGYLQLCCPMGFPAGEGQEFIWFMNFALCSFSECVGRKSHSVSRAKVPGALSRAGVAVMEPGLKSSSGRWLLISSPLHPQSQARALL